MDEAQWKRIMDINPTGSNEIEQNNLVNQLKRRTTLIKYKANGRSYSRLYYLGLSEDAIFYQGSKNKSKSQVYLIKDIEQIRPGFTTSVWKKCLKTKKVMNQQENLALSILYDNNRKSLDLIAENEETRSRWIEGLQYLVGRYQYHKRSHREITDRWISHLFDQADIDHSGQLNRQEVRRILHTFNIVLDDQEIDSYFTQANIRTNNYNELVHLDKDEFLIFYKFVSQRPELLKIICQFNGSNNEQMAATIAEYSVVHKLPHLHITERLRNGHSLPFRTRKSTKTNTLTTSFRRRSASITPETPVSTSQTVQRRNYLTIEQLKEFLQHEEHIKALSIEDCSRLIARFEPSNEGRHCEEIGVDGLRLLLLHDEFCLMNAEKANRVYHDMTRPITDYFIATSHNTYIQKNQVFGDCTAETYIHALRNGCRAVEMDCYDGELMEPVVYHGNTMTVSILFRDILMAIESEAFTLSPFPLFLNIENHCSYEGQRLMAKHLKEIFKDHLLTKPLFEEFQTLPSPEQLKYKVLIRSRRYPKGIVAADPKSNKSSDETEPNPKDFHPDFAELIVYAQIVSFTNIHHTLRTQKCFHSISFKESKAKALIDAESPHHREFIALTKQHLVRVYPGTLRQDSSNFHPPFYWTYGVQMVALNYQADDEAMCLQQGFFSDNGGCGYLLKPSCLLANDQTFDPKEKIYEKGKRLHIHLISGQHLPKERDSIENPDISDPYVKIYTCGVNCDYSEHRTPSIRNNGLNPIWDYKIAVDIYCPDLCLVRFQVRDHDRYKNSSFIGQACIPFNALQLGYRHVKLRSKNGDFIHGTLFVHIKIDDF